MKEETADEEKGYLTLGDNTRSDVGAANPGTVMVPNAGPRFKDQLQSQIGERPPQHDGTLSALSNSCWEGDGVATNDDDRSSHNPIPTRQKAPTAFTRATHVATERRGNNDNNSMPVLQAVPVEDAVEVPDSDVHVFIPGEEQRDKEEQQRRRRGETVRCVILSTVILGSLLAIIVGILYSRRPDKVEVFSSQQELYDAIDTYWTAMTVQEQRTTTSLDDIVRRYGPLSEWRVDQVTNFSHMFSAKRNPLLAASFDADLSQWDVRSATDVSFMFFGASNFSSTTDLTGWDTSRVTTMQAMFHGASKFNGDVTTWNVGQVRVFGRMFSDVRSFNQDISRWDMRNAVDCKWMVRTVRSPCSFAETKPHQ